VQPAADAGGKEEEQKGIECVEWTRTKMLNKTRTKKKMDVRGSDLKIKN
jgi:hypothetical protein